METRERTRFFLAQYTPHHVVTLNKHYGSHINNNIKATPAAAADKHVRTITNSMSHI